MNSEATVLAAYPVEATQNTSRWSGILLAMLPHLLFAFVTTFEPALMGDHQKPGATSGEGNIWLPS
jgi:hypothetical protein